MTRPISKRRHPVIEDAGSGDLIAIAGDVTNPDHAARLVEAAIGAGDFSLLVNNASLLGPSPQPLADYPLDVLEEVVATDLLAPLRLIQLSLPHLARRRNSGEHHVRCRGRGL